MNDLKNLFCVLALCSAAWVSPAQGAGAHIPTLIRSPPRHQAPIDLSRFAHGYCITSQKQAVGSDALISYSAIWTNANIRKGTATCATDPPVDDAYVLVIPGFGLGRASMLGYGKYFAQKGYISLLVEPPGQGASSGTYIGFGPYEARQIDRLIERLNLPAAARIDVLGYSYGGVVALDLASISKRYDAIVAIAPFADVRAAVVRYAEATGRSLPIDPPLGAQFEAASALLGYDLEATGPKSTVKKIATHVLFISGTRDMIADSRAIEVLSSEVAHAQYVSMQGYSHAQLLYQSPAVLRQIQSWLDTLR